jgi:RNase P/RNase MRP subunit POP5
MKRRYLALRIESTREIDEKEFKNAVWNAIQRLFGEYGASKTGLVVISCDAAKNYAVLRCANTAVEMIRASLTSITEINTKPAAILVMGVSGTVKSLRGKFPPP